MSHVDFDSNVPRAAELIERWLLARLSGSPSPDVDLTPLRSHAPSERLAIVRAILDRNPWLAQAARRVGTYDQLRLTLELVRIGASRSAPVVAGVHRPSCMTRYRGQGRARRQN